MATINQNDLRIKNAKNFTESLNTPTGDALSYVFMGRVEPWADDNLPPVPQNNFRGFIETYDNMFAARRILDKDVYYMIPRIQWNTGNVYDYYRQDYTVVNRSYSGASNLYDCRFIVKNSLNSVYVCLNLSLIHI